MNKFICNIEPFKNYIHDSSAAIFSEESNKKHDWYRKMHCSVLIDDHTYGLSILPTVAEGHANCEYFTFIFDLELAASVTKTEARRIICSFVDAVKFHPNIDVADTTDHGRAVVSERCFWLQPTEFKCINYCWDEIPERADRWHAQIFMTVEQTPSPNTGTWGRSFDLNLDPVSLLRATIRIRDNEIARKKAEEEAERIAEEEAERERQEACEKLKGFLESIGDFVILDAGVLTPIKDLWIKFDGDILLLGNRGRDPFQLSLVNGFDENVKKIINWAVENGAREPEKVFAG